MIARMDNRDNSLGPSATATYLVPFEAARGILVHMRVGKAQMCSLARVFPTRT